MPANVPINPHDAPKSPYPRARETTAILRAIDAAANRTREGLRVVEDLCRFALDDRHLVEQCKQMRHDLTAALSAVPLTSRLAARDTRADVGTSLSTPGERTRADVQALLAANCTRVQEGLRGLEEMGKLGGWAFVGEVKGLRYASYTLQRAIDITRDSRRRLADARLYVLIDGRASADQFERIVTAMVEAGVGLIQLRDKRLPDRELITRARQLVALTRGSDTLAIINDRPDLAALSRADGVHVGQDELSVKDARAIVGPGALVGVSTHSIDQARRAVLEGAGYIGVGPTFPGGTKSFDRYPGVDLLRAVAAEISLPAFAIGGITAENVDEVLAAGFRRIAVSGAVLGADDPASAARALLAKLGGPANGNNEPSG